MIIDCPVLTPFLTPIPRTTGKKGGKFYFKENNLRGPGAGGARPREEGGEGDGAPPSSRPRTG